MEVHGELLSSEDREQTKAHFCKNDGKKWDLHEMSLYVESGYHAIEGDSETSNMLKNGMARLRGGQQHE